MSAAAQEVSERVRKMNEARARKRAERGGGAKPRKAKAERKAKGERKPRARKAKPEGEAPAARAVDSGLKAKPKGPSLFINTVGAKAIALKGLQALSPADLTAEEQWDRDRLIARLEARQ